jgi:hypothetical protein
MPSQWDYDEAMGDRLFIAVVLTASALSVALLGAVFFLK